MSELDVRTLALAKAGISKLSKEIADLNGVAHLIEVPITEDDVVYGAMIYGLNGSELATAAWNCTKFLDAQFDANSEVTVKSAVYGNGGFAFYDSNKDFILGVYGENCEEYGITADGMIQTMKILIPEHTAYMRLSFPTAYGETYADLALTGYKTSNIGTRVSALEERVSEKVHLPMDENGNIDKGIVGLYAVSDGQGGIMWDRVSDEQLLRKGLTLTLDSGLNASSVWTGASTDTPVFYEGSDRFCTRKLKVSKLPVLVSGLGGPWKYTFWLDEKNVGTELPYADAKAADFRTDIVFDEVAISYGYGANTENLSVTFQIFDGEQFAFNKVLVMGDSISADYYGNYPKWVTILVDDGFLPAQATTNDSIHATGFVARYNNEANDFLTRIEAVANKSAYDLVVVFGGINDFIQSIPLGESGGDKSVNFKPAVDYFFDYLVNNFTQARIVVLSPLRTYNVYPNQAGSEQSAYTAYIREVAKKYCLPVLNLTEESGFIPFNDAFTDMWTFTGWSGGDGTQGDGVHPSEEYIRKFLAPMIKGFLMSIKPK